MTESTVSRRIAEFSTGLRWARIPAQVQDRARDRVLDAFSTAVYCSDLEDSVTARSAVAGEPGGTCSSLVDDIGRTAENAAFVNSVATSAIFFDDLGPVGSDHPGSVVIPTALAVAEEASRARPDLTLADFLTAVVIGYEVQLALGDVAARAVMAAGFRTTPVFGTVAAAATAARLYGLDLAHATAAIDISANLAFGLCETRARGTIEGYLHPGLAARGGIHAAKIGRAGARTATRTFEGPSGYFNAFRATGAADRFSVADRWRILEVWTKPFPLSGGKLHSVGNAVAAVESGVQVADIAHVTVEIKQASVDYNGGAMNRRAPFETFNSAQISIQFCIAAALLGFDMTDIDTFRKHFDDPTIAELTQRIDVVGYGDGRGDTLQIEFTDGAVRRFQVGWDEIVVPSIRGMTDKLRHLSRDRWDSSRVHRVVSAVCGDPDAPLSSVSRALRS